MKGWSYERLHLVGQSTIIPLETGTESYFISLKAFRSILSKRWAVSANVLRLICSIVVRSQRHSANTCIEEQYLNHLTLQFKNSVVLKLADLILLILGQATEIYYAHTHISIYL